MTDPCFAFVETKGSPAEQRMPAIGAIGPIGAIGAVGRDRAQPMYEFPAAPKLTDDVFFDLIELDKVAFGQPFNVTIHVQVNASFRPDRFGIHSNPLKPIDIEQNALELKNG